MDKLIHPILTVHSFVRWLVLLVAVITTLKFAWGWMRSGEFNNVDHVLAAAFRGLFVLQVTLGLIYFLWSGYTGDGFPRFRFEHGTTMFLALVCAHLPVRWKNTDDKTRFRNSMFAILASIVLILIGISRLPGGLSR